MGTELLSVGFPSVRSLSPPGDSSSGAASHPRKIAQSNWEKQQNRSTQGESHPTTIAMLPDDVLLEIFHFYRKDHHYTRRSIWNWHLLAHVCQEWRQIVFSSPHHLGLKIICTYGTPVRNLGIWPAFPIIIRYERSWTPIRPNDEDGIVYALEHRDRVCEIELDPGVQWNSRSEEFDAAWLEPFPVLTRLYIDSPYRDASVLPANFLGGSAPRLQEITLSGIPYPALPILLLSASNLVKLDLRDIPPTGYISPEAMVASLAVLPRLDYFLIRFQSATPRPDIHPPSVTRTALPALTEFHFRGTSEYLEDLISQIDSPQLRQISIEYLRFVDYQITELSKFIDRSVGLKLTLSKHADIHFYSADTFFSVYPHVNRPSLDLHPPEARVTCGGVDWRAMDIARLISHFRISHSNVVHLNITAGKSRLRDIGDVDWLNLLQQFPTVQTLRLHRDPAVHVALALEAISGELVAEVLPSLDLIYMADQPASLMEKFIAARRLSGRPVTVIDTETEFNERIELYVSK